MCQGHSSCHEGKTEREKKRERERERERVGRPGEIILSFTVVKKKKRKMKM